jgi:hypothetical protein
MLFEDRTYGRGSVPCGCDCCQYCCQAAGQRLSWVDSCGMSAQRTDGNRRSWTTCLSLRSRRSATTASRLPSWGPFGDHTLRARPDNPQITERRDVTGSAGESLRQRLPGAPDHYPRRHIRHHLHLAIDQHRRLGVRFRRRICDQRRRVPGLLQIQLGARVLEDRPRLHQLRRQRAT